MYLMNKKNQQKMTSGCSASTQLMAKTLKSMNKKTMKQLHLSNLHREDCGCCETYGDNSLLCEDMCALGLDRKCAWLSKDAFAKIGDPNTPFHCPRCRMDKLECQHFMQEESISALKSSHQQEVSTLKIELTALANAVKELQSSLSAASSTVPIAFTSGTMAYATVLSGHLLEASPKGFTFHNHSCMINTANHNSHLSCM